MLYVIIIVLVLLYILGNKEGFDMHINNMSTIGKYEPTYSSREGMVDWLNVSDLEYSKIVSKLQGKNEAVTIRNLV